CLARPRALNRRRAERVARRTPTTPPTALAAVLAAFLLAAGCAARAADELHVNGSALHVHFDHTAFAGGAAPLLEWVTRSADIVSRYYARFPAPSATVRLVPQSGAGVHDGKTFANPDAYIRVQLGREVTAAQLLSDWVLVHEMTHLALPDTG